MPTTSVFYPVEVARPSAVAPFAELVQRGPLARLWLGQSTRLETHQVLAYLAGAGLTVPMGTAVTLLPLRHPYEAAVEARSLAALTGQPYVAGFGASWPLFVESLLGEPYASPKRATCEYLATVRTLLDGEIHQRHGALVPMEHPPVEVGAGVLRPAMARAAGAVADVAITWMTPPEYLRDTLVPALREAGRNPRVATVVHVATKQPGRDPRRLARLGAVGHLRLPHYAEMARLAGLDIDPADPAGCAAALVDSGVFVSGTEEEIGERLAQYHAAGVDEIILNPCGVLAAEGAAAALADVTRIAECAQRS
ncbi:LLM class flavin-dependent oxidoreductase [Allokutzneria oryzae]|uniref:LLM class flavin-dependent oxidoreductase n=1 Tax=Allokutzneria oryzae TaxID=1378989 RepID=A0ABV5ZSL7_9PSEU